MTRKLRTNTALPAIAVFLLAGAVPAAAQSSSTTRENQRQAQPDDTRRANQNPRSTVRIDEARRGSRMLMFAKSSDIVGATVKNPNDEDLGEVQDFIVDRGSGKIRFAVIRSGAFLGIGGKSFAVPYNQLEWTPNTKSYFARMTREQIDRQVEFTPEDWNTLEETTWMDQFQDWADEDDRRSYDDNVTIDRNAKPVEISGRITEVDRVNEGTPYEQIRVTLQTREGQTDEITLGPSWYVMAHRSAPLRGDTLVVRGVRQGNEFIAYTAGPKDNELHLRDSNGRIAWEDGRHTDHRDGANRTGNDRDRADRDRMTDRSPGDENRRGGRYVMLTDLVGADADARGASDGEIQSAVVEAVSGRVAFLAFDPNENFLGIGDGVTLVPWSVASIDHDLNVHLDTSKDVLDSATRMPDDLTSLNSDEARVVIYRAFRVQPAEFRNDNGPLSEKERTMTGDAWVKDSMITKTLADGRKVEFNGTVTSISKETIMTGAPEATVMTIRLEAGGTERVILGPAWYTDQQQFRFRVGDKVKVKGRNAMIREQSHTAAWSVEHNGETTNLWNDKTPAWTK
jgi:sporulation protein YlmC with PRC-barrel domain